MLQPIPKLLDAEGVVAIFFLGLERVRAHGLWHLQAPCGHIPSIPPWSIGNNSAPVRLQQSALGLCSQPGYPPTSVMLPHSVRCPSHLGSPPASTSQMAFPKTMRPFLTGRFCSDCLWSLPVTPADLLNGQSLAPHGSLSSIELYPLPCQAPSHLCSLVCCQFPRNLNLLPVPFRGCLPPSLLAYRTWFLGFLCLAASTQALFKRLIAKHS